LLVKGKDAANNDVEHLLNAGLVPSLVLQNEVPGPFSNEVKGKVRSDAVVQ
jgi:hypothetical protein